MTRQQATGKSAASRSIAYLEERSDEERCRRGVPEASHIVAYPEEPARGAMVKPRHSRSGRQITSARREAGTSSSGGRRARR